ncbi:SDR family NAD(P)-dependent oxidoreductase [Streptomyces acidicola]|uniref:SDR family NAD(P)-dependent oxidoreductase n=1 Tax=Streptomyces acidicola TaxID=2596892 RepID=UPI00381106B4
MHHHDRAHYRRALVTGASSGLGEVFARELAASGCDLVLVARSADRLNDLADRLRTRYGRLVEVLPADLTRPGELAAVERRLAQEEAPTDLLVNNAGVLGRIAPLAQQDLQGPQELIDLDVRAVVRLTRAAVAAMGGRGEGGVLNVSSMMGFLPAPRGAVYGGAKAFVTSFSESVHCESAHLGVHVTALCPGSVRTGLHHSSGSRGGGRLGRFLEPEAVVRDGLAAVAAGRPVCVPGADYRLKAKLSGALPRAWVRRAVLRRWKQNEPRPKSDQPQPTPHRPHQAENQPRQPQRHRTPPPPSAPAAERGSTT